MNSVNKNNVKGRLRDNILLFIVSVTVVLLISEFGVRLLFGDKIVLFNRYHTEAKYGEYTIRKLRPNTEFWHTSVDGSWRFNINNNGFRNDSDFDYKKDDGKVRVITLGDSHTQGFEVRQDKTYAKVIEDYLETVSIDAEVINAGVSGFSTAEALVFLENEGIKYKPDYVVLGFYANDFEDNIKSGLFKIKNDELVEAKKEHIPGVKILNVINEIAPLRWLSENSYLYAFAMNSAWEIGKRLLYSKATSELKTEYAVPVQGVLDSYSTELSLKLIERMHDFTSQNGIKFILLDIPKRPQVHQFSSSIPRELKGQITKLSDFYIDSEDVLGEYRGLVDFHVLHGHLHISEFSHLMLGIEAGRFIKTDVRKYK
ncbi:MAG: hypothetical protein OI74_11880 [Gammaproteobacteria bacterium (ex Lamellibrachia satsuma)]|nr:MAG: hypothetical protein HPY30_01925 [Gammaproteobacteria bacterium (ex Lamellibrachia satsuma)]RRS32242.1 MAG: hypothetical protein OI74_11880 [Gammaproteobacteria bacterium (ex Lamellibrachia satsuma)]RRS33248.1 MAG: hypothetical protein NV67_16725 [Gammaproteobacteria bacterium (ex Lamellibrachia satsuma)]